MYETRLITINSAQREPGELNTSTHFEISLNNAGKTRDHIVGISVESVGFVNIIGNVHDYCTVLYIEQAGLSYEVQIPAGQYNYVELADIVTEGINSVLMLGGAFQVVPIAPADGQPAMIQLVYDEAGDPITILALRESMSHVLGFTENINLGFGLVNPAFRPNLYGDMAVLLSTRTLASGHSIDGRGDPSSTVMTIPIKAQYGTVNHVHVGGEERPLVMFSTHGRSINNIDVQLLHLDGKTTVDIGTSEMFVTFRLWLHHH